MIPLGWRNVLTAFLWESSFNIITWVCIAASLGFALLFYSKGEMRGFLWSLIALIICTVLMLGVIADRHFFQGPPKRRPTVERQETPEPEFPSFDVKVSKYTFMVGDIGIMVEYSPQQLKEPQQLPMSLWGPIPISVYTDGKHLLADVILRDASNGQTEIALRKNVLFGKPYG